MKNNFEKYAKLGGYIVLALAVLSLALGIFTSLDYLESFRIVFGSVYVLFLPGFVMSFIFFTKTKEFDSTQMSVSPQGQKDEDGIDWIERIALSFALSIAIVPLAVFYLNLIGVRINLLNSSLTILGIILISLGILYHKNKKLLF